jgi:NADH-quinone oxidoreductase subunit J
VTLAQIAFFILSLLALVSGILMITRRNVVHSVIWLIVALFSVAGIFLMLEAEFLFAVQIILYVGGIMVLFLFAVMLVNVEASLKEARFNRQWALALGTSLLLLAELGYGVYSARHGFRMVPASVAAGPGPGANNTQLIGSALYGNYMLPVEIASILLLVAMVGAVIMTKRRLS